MTRRLFSAATLSFALLLSGGFPLAATKSISVTPRLESKLKEGKRYALIIGIGRYRDKRIPRLRYTVADARAMYDVLTDPSHGRFPKESVRLLLDEEATLVNIRGGLNWLAREAGENDTVVVYYSGHGAPEGDETFWVSHDADLDDIASTAVENRYITGRLERIRAKRLVSFLDSCYSAAIVEKRDAPKALFDQDFFRSYQGTGRVTITASDGKQLSLESEDFGHGVFTHYLLEALRGKADRNADGAVEIEEVWEHLRRKVTEEARRRNNRQEPRIIGSFSAGFLLSLNPAALEREKARREALARLLAEKKITGVEFEEAVKILDGEVAGEMGKRLLPLAQQLADGRLLPESYRLARAGATAGLSEPAETRKAPPAEPPSFPSTPLPSDRFARLLAKADAQIALLRLTSPEKDNAFETLMAANALEANHPEVARRLGRIAGIYKEWARAQLKAGELDRARAYLERARRITPEDPALADLRADLEKAGRAKDVGAGLPARPGVGAQHAAPLQPSPPTRPDVGAGLSLPSAKAGGPGPSPPRVAVGPGTPHEIGSGLDAMVLVPAGWFIMGSNDGEGDEKPQRRVYLDAFYIDKYPVTNAQFRRFGKPAHDYGENFNGDKQPVVGVAWFQARDYCQSVGKRLPTEAEWEKAVRGVDGRKYPWGNGWDETKLIWVRNGGGRTHSVDRSYNTHRSPFGAVDMAGNVWQWVADWYDANYYRSTLDRNPQGPASGSMRVVRGGSWGFVIPTSFRAADRGWNNPAGRDNGGSFRCAKASK